MNYDFDEILDRSRSWSSKWNHAPDGEPPKKGYIPMWVADMDFPCAPVIAEAVRRKTEDRAFGYSTVPQEYWQTVCSFYKRRHGFDCTPEEIVFTQGVVPAITAAVKAVTSPGDEVIIQTPVYHPFYGAAVANETVISANPLILSPEGYYTMDLEDLERRAASPKATAMILCSPHNPVGRVWTEQELRSVEDICLRNGVTLIIDEIHNDLIRGKIKHHSGFALFPDAPNLVVCTAPTKTFNLAALGISHMFVKDPALREKIKAQVGRQSVNPLSASAAIAAMDGGCDDWLEQLNAYTDGNFRLLRQLCAKFFPKAVLSPAEGTYLAWLDLRQYIGEDSAGFEGRFYADCGVYISRGDPFGGKGWMRINLGTPKAYIIAAMSRAAARYSTNPAALKLYANDELPLIFPEAKKYPAFRETFLETVFQIGDCIQNGEKGILTVSEEQKQKRREFLEKEFDRADSYQDFIRFYKTQLNNEILDAAFRRIK